jgi:hypothetical protein
MTGDKRLVRLRRTESVMFRRDSRRILPILVLLGVVLLVGSGCTRSRSYDRFIPSEDTARHCIDMAMAAWQQGVPPGPLATSSPEVHVVDSERRPNQRLVGYEILGEVPGDGPRCFAVRLELENPREEKTARYLVIGIEPLRVFRHEDFVMLAHWDNCPPAEPEPDIKVSPAK